MAGATCSSQGPAPSQKGQEPRRLLTGTRDTPDEEWATAGKAQSGEAPAPRAERQAREGCAGGRGVVWKPLHWGRRQGFLASPEGPLWGQTDLDSLPDLLVHLNLHLPFFICKAGSTVILALGTGTGGMYEVPRGSVLFSKNYQSPLPRIKCTPCFKFYAGGAGYKPCM